MKNKIIKNTLYVTLNLKMSARLYSLRVPNKYHIITIANTEEEAKLIFKTQFKIEPIEILVFDTKCSLSLSMTCKWCENVDVPYCCNCASVICATPLQ